MELNQAIRERISCRNFSSKNIPKHYVEEILEAAKLAPSPKNRQPWRFVILRHDKKFEFEMLLSVTQDSTIYMSDESKKLNEWDSWKNSRKIIQSADTIILVFNKYPSSLTLDKPNTLFDLTNVQSIGAAIQNMLLKATALNIGSLWICDVFSHYHEICERYYPEGQFIAAVALGYPVENSYRSTRKLLKDLIIEED